MEEDRSFIDKISIKESDYCLAYSFRLVKYLYQANFTMWGLEQVRQGKNEYFCQNIRERDGNIIVSVDKDICFVVLENWERVLPKSRLAFQADFFRVLDLLSIAYCCEKRNRAADAEPISAICFSIYDYMDLRGTDRTAANKHNAKKSIVNVLELLCAITVQCDSFDSKLISGYRYSRDVFTVELSAQCSQSFHADRLKMKYPLSLFQVDGNNCNSCAYILGHKLAETGTGRINPRRGPNDTISVRSLLAICPSFIQKPAVKGRNPKNLYRKIFCPLQHALDCLLEFGILSVPASYDFEGTTFQASDMQKLLSHISFTSLLDIKVRFVLDGVPKPYFYT